MPAWSSGATPVGRQLTDADKFIGAGDDPDVLTSFTIGDVFESETGVDLNDAIVAANSNISDLQNTIAALASVISGLGDGTVQVVSTASATITDARIVVVIYDAGTCTLTLPNAVAARELIVVKAHDEEEDIVLDRSASDAGASGTINGVTGSLTITSNDSGSRAQYRVVGRATRHWEAEDRSGDVALEASISALTASVIATAGIIDAEGYGVQVITGTMGTITTARNVFLTNTGAAITITLPDAAAARSIRLFKANSATTQTITLARSANDAAGAGSINGTAASFDIVMTSISGTRRAWDVSASAVLEWHVDNGETAALTALAATVSTNTSNISTNTTDIAALKAGVVTLQTISSTGTQTVNQDTAIARVTANGNTLLTLPTPSAGKCVTVVKDINGAGGTITLDPGTNTIHGSTTDFVLTGSGATGVADIERISWVVVGIDATSWMVL